MMNGVKFAPASEPQLRPLSSTEQWPETTKFRAEADGIEVRHILIHKAGHAIRQHSHKFPHLTVISHGAVRIWLGGILQGDTYAPGAVNIPAGTKHLIMALADDTAIQCVHNVSRSGEIELAEGEV